MPGIQIPRRENQLLNLTLRIQAFHEVQQQRSYLDAAFNMQRLRDKTQKVICYHLCTPVNSREARKIKKLKRRELRFISREVQGIRNLLQAIYPDDIKIMRKWGFEV